ncbi:uncharacterized protein K02A2.6-like [Ischnura elegans]|uniref:uncharacterized protein K02A2.6-like n=1 Tax=Ischnura elegans TaxID=197161 RepID=UPI001ED88F04|nr:uncharacterized protein K02A2.6-like [Ischnura elegans]
MSSHFIPTACVWVERDKFDARMQGPDEAFKDFLADLKQLAEHCKFDNLDQALLRQVLRGMRNLSLKEQLFSLKFEELTLRVATDRAIAAERARVHVRQFQSAGSVEVINIHSVSSPRQVTRAVGSGPDGPRHEHQGRGPAQSGTGCHRCGFPSPHNCPMKDATCHYCHLKGHIAKMCFRKRRAAMQRSDGGAQQQQHRGHQEDADRFEPRRDNVQERTYGGPSVRQQRNQGFRGGHGPSWRIQGSSQHHLPSSSQHYLPSPDESPEPGFRGGHGPSWQHQGSSQHHLPSPDESPEPVPSPSSANQIRSMLFHTPASVAPAPIKIYVNIENVPVLMEVDSGAGHTIIGKTLYDEKFPFLKISPSEIRLSTWSNQKLDILGQCMVNVSYNNENARLLLLVAATPGPSLLGRSWFKNLMISVSGVNHLSNFDSLPREIADFHHVFSPGLGKYSGPPARIHLKNDAKPVFKKARPVPFALLPRVDKELDNLVNEGILVPVKVSEWATPVVNVLKRDGTIRICGDYSCTVNPNCLRDVYPLPTIDELLAKLAGGKFFARFDLSLAFLQLTVDPETAKLLTLNTHKGLFQVHRLSQGLSASPGIFQRTMETLLAGLKGVVVYLDDILVQASSKEELWQRVREALSRISTAGLRLRPEKCQFGVTSIQFVGYLINGHGIFPTNEKVKAILSAPVPHNVDTLRVYLGFINYYDRFFPNKGSRFHILYDLLKQDTPWNWSSAHDECIEYVKRVVTTASLVHFDPNLPLVLACDASPHGVGAVLSHVMPDGDEKPVAFASRVLKPVEKNYSHVDKESLAVIFGVQKFYMYLWGRNFTIITDSKPVVGIFNSERKQLPEVLSPRVLRWCLYLANFNYVIKHRPGSNHCNADFLSRLPIDQDGDDSFPDPAGILLLEEAPPSSALTASSIAEVTQRDPVLSIVLDCILRGRQFSSDPAVQTFLRGHGGSLSVTSGCLLRGDRVVIPAALRPSVLQLLHKAHQGIVRTKRVARSYAWWPNIDKDIEIMIKSCESCALAQNSPPKAKVMSWDIPKKPWSRVHVDFAGPFHGHTLFILIDATSKWVEVAFTKGSFSSSTVICQLKRWFSTHGLPDLVVSDNGPAFTSEQFKIYLEGNGISHYLTPPYHPASNGQVERTVQTIKRLLRKLPSKDWVEELPNILLMLRSTPNDMGRAPSEILMGRKLTTLLDRLLPNTGIDGGEGRPDSSLKSYKYSLGDLVYFRVYYGGKRVWQRGTIVGIEGTRIFKVKNEEGKIERRHVDQLQRRISPNDNSQFISQAWSPGRNVEERSSWDWRGELPPLILDEVPEPTVVNGSPSTAPSPETETDEDTRPEAQVAVDNSPGQDNRPRRMTKQPPYLKDYFVN